MGIVLLASVGLTISVAIDSTMTKRDTHPFGEEYGSPTERMLRSYTISKENDEERVVLALNKVTTPLKAGAAKFANEVRVRLWLKKEYSVDDVWRMLQLNGDLKNVIANPKLELLDKYVGLFNKKYKNQESLVGILSLRYGEDNVMMALLDARQVDNHGNSVNDVFKILKIEDDGPKFMENPKLRLLEEYIEIFNFKKPHEKTKYFGALTKGFGGDGKFAIVLSNAMEITSVEVQALGYQEKLFRKWMKNGVDPKNFLTKIFNIDEKNLASAGPQERAIADEYKTYYIDESEIKKFVNPRRK
ncbi:RxLR effector protein [Phytophthora megakarya]|uniref:RxLR effector protein n=1 Tax=Phytophthora megakarya TaxID=4795 RepID=A0A225UKM6_9STRA|nr:RxLR effector protein [Phytophthora megakarya]